MIGNRWKPPGCCALPYLTATHGRDNPRSGAVMQRIGMTYCYTYRERWQPKNRWVYFRMYQLNLDGQQDRVYKAYWNKYPVHFVESLEGGLHLQPSQKLPSGQPGTPDAPKAGKQA